jgi:hypothetical protein
MAVEALKSTPITNADATPVVFNNSRVARGDLHQAVGYAVADAVASIGSTYRLCRVPSNAFALNVFLSNTAFTATGAADIGIYKTNGGVVVDADFFASAALLTAAQYEVNVTHESLVYGANDIEKPLWQALGLTEDPQIDYDVVLTLTAANTAAAADVALRVQYTQ